jgi:hypothetical protein
MAHTDPENVIPQKPPPPPDRRTPQPSELPVDPQAPTQPDRIPPQTPIEAPPGQPIAPRVAAPAPSSRRGARKPSGHIAIPHMPDIDPIVIGQAGQRARMKSDPLVLVDYPRLNRPAFMRAPTT